MYTITTDQLEYLLSKLDQNVEFTPKFFFDYIVQELERLNSTAPSGKKPGRRYGGPHRELDLKELW